MKLLRPLLTLSLLLVFYSALEAQKRCATVEYQTLNRSGENIIKSEKQFEKVLAEQIQARRRNPFSRIEPQGTYQIPVVVHVIHNGEALGVGRNIPDAQIISQINVLNKDFNRENDDQINTPADFLSVAGNLDIEFVLAKQDPNGNCTSGIARVNGNREQWSLSREAQFKALSYWPAEDYLNIWVLHFSGYLGYASFPTLSGLPGLDEDEENPLLDGVVIDYRVFGSIDDGPFALDETYNKGRTTTHEVGHFFGLRHIWGDDNDCSQSDYVEDTPDQEDETYDCNLTVSSPVIHPEADACTSMKMFQNYMDYTDDVCMNLFTQDQVARMMVVLENSPRRGSLFTSHGLEEPATQDIVDLMVTDIDFPSEITCAVGRGTKTPFTLSLANVTTSDVDEVTYFISINQAPATMYQSPVSFINNEAELVITALPGLQIGHNTVRITVSGGGCDPTPANNQIQFEVELLDNSCDPFVIYTQPDGQTVITFDLPKTSFSRISVINLIGQEVTHIDTPQTSNQTIGFSVFPGAYIVRVQIGATYYVRKVYLHP